MRTHIINIACAALLAGGCSAKSAMSLMVVSVDSDATLSDVATLHARATVGDTTREFDVHPTGGGPLTIPPAQTFGLDLPRSFTGDVAIHVDALDSTGALIASGDGSGPIRVGARADLAIHLTATSPAGDDLGGSSSDLAGTVADMAQPTGDMVVIPPAMLTIDKTTQSFGDIVIGKTSTTASFLVTNAGGMPSSVASLTPGGANLAEFTIDTDCGPSLMPGGRCHVTATVTPTSAGMKTATFALAAAQGGNVGGTLTANALTAGAVKLLQPSGDCGSALVGAQSATSATFTVKNTGDSPTTALAVNTSDAQFKATGCVGTILAAGDTCTVTVKFTPSTSGTQNASLTVSATTGGADTASLVGVGLKPASLSVSPPSATYASVVQGGTGDSATFTVSNAGDVASAAMSAATLSGTNPTSFAITADNCKNAPVGPAPASCTIVVQFKPQVTGSNSATLNVSAGATSVGTPSLSGTGLKPASLKISPATMTSFTKGQTATFTVSNAGEVASSALTTATLGGANAASFSIVNDHCKATTVGPSPASCTIDVKFAPTTTGTQSATLTTSATTGGSVSATLGGPGLNPASLRLSPDHYTFPTVPRASMGGMTTFTVFNDGEVAAPALAAASLSGAASSFKLTDSCQGKALGPSPASCTITVQFTPTVSGANNATMTVKTASTTVGAAMLSGSATPVWVQEATNLDLSGLGVNTVWAADANHVWAGGDNGLIAFRDGSGNWTSVALSYTITSIWGSGPTNVYAAGPQRLQNSTGNGVWNDLGTDHVGDIWGFSSADVFVAGNSIVWHDTPATGWTSESLVGTSGIWGSSDTDLFVFGNVRVCAEPPICSTYGVISHRDATTWTKQYQYISPGVTGLWGFGAPATTLYATAYNLAPLHSTGNGAWDQLPSPAPTNCTAVWGADSTHMLFACGGIYTYDGSNWSGPELAGDDLRAIYGTASDNVYAVGFEAIYHYY